jgi:hypothetical protein
MVYKEESMTTSFQTLSNSLSANNPTLRHCTAWHTDHIVEWNISKIIKQLNATEKKNSVVLIPLANYTDREIAAGQRS